jgi:uncharacterized membrane protein YqjE
MTAPLDTTPPVGELLKALARDTGELVRQEVQLASAEMASKARTVARSATWISLGGALAHLGVLGLLAAIAIALGAIMPLWASTLVLGIVALIVGAVFIRKGASALQRLQPLPQQTVATLRSDVAWTKEQLR